MRLRRRHWFEVTDLSICPAVVRDAATDWIAFMMNSHKGFNTLAPQLVDALERTGDTRIVDLCSGGGGPWLTLEREVSRSRKVEVLLTDLFPNGACRTNLESSAGAFTVHPEPVDARAVPEALSGFRTMMSGFHHFRPAEARAILQSAVDQRRGIAVFEGSDSRMRGLAMAPLVALMMILFTPQVKPFRLSRLLLTYALPVMPLVAYWDASVSMLRTYSPPEMRELIRGVRGHETYDWKVGTTKVAGSPLGLTYLVGVPKAGGAS